MCLTNIPTLPGNNAPSNNLHNNLFLPGFSSSPGWLLVIRSRGAWWCRYRGHCRSRLDIFLHGPESAHKNAIVEEFTHTSIPIHPCTLLKKEKEKRRRPKRSTDQTWSLCFLVLFLSNVVVVGNSQEAWHLLLMTAPRRRPSRLGQYWQKTFVEVFNKYSNITR